MQQLWDKVRKDGPVAQLRPDLGRCWPWSGATDARGYGLIRIAGKLQRAHRVAYALAKGPIKPGLPLEQFACTTVGCCNPAHYQAPFWDAALATLPGAGLPPRRHCRYGHLLSPRNRYRRPDGTVECRECRAASRRRWRARRGLTARQARG
jgi:hypothetical protein